MVGRRYGRSRTDPAIVPASVSATSIHMPRSAATSTRADPTATAAAARMCCPVVAREEARDAWRRLQARPLEPLTREADAEQHAAPFPDERSGRLGTAARQRLGQLGRQLARLRQRLGELLVHSGGPERRSQPVDQLGGPMQLVLETRQAIAVLEQPLRVGGERVEPCQCQLEVDPETAHGVCVDTRRPGGKRLPHRRFDHSPL